MAHISSQVETSPTPSIQSLKSRFEQFALDNASSSANSKPTTGSVAPVLAWGQSIASPKLAPMSRSQMRQSLIADDCIVHSQPVAPVSSVRSKVSAPDMKPVALKRAPPPIPPPRGKAPSSTSPLLRPVPVPVALKSPNASPESEPLSLQRGRKNSGAEESSEDGSSTSVASLRSMFL